MIEKKASQIMTKAVVSATQDMSLKEAISLLLRYHISGMPVIDDESNLVGIITEKDVINATFDGNASWTKVKEVMSKDLTFFRPDTDIIEIAECFINKKIRRVPIVEDKKVIGIISRRDILREILNLK